MSTGFASVLLFDGECEETLRAEFIRLSAKYRSSGYSAYDIAQHVFSKLREPHLRALQAAEVWGSDLAVKEQIDRLASVGNYPPDEAEKSALMGRLLRTADDPRTPARDRINAIELLAKMGGLIPKDGPTVVVETPKQYVIAERQD